MASSKKADVFIQKLFAINPQYVDIFGNGLPGMVGKSIATQGVSTSATDVVGQLRRDAALLANAKAKSDAKTVAAIADTIEGHLLLLQTLGAISRQLSNSLITELHEVAEVFPEPHY